MSWRSREREKVERDWNYNQAALMGGILCSFILPLAWGLAANSDWGWLGYTKFVAISAPGIALIGEGIRRYSNWALGEPVCKWIWQK